MMTTAANSPWMTLRMNRNFRALTADVLAEQARASGRPEEIIAKMVEGRLRKFFEEVALLEQPFIMDNDKKVAAVVKEAEKDVGAAISIEGFVRYALGEGVEKVETDFAAEVAAAAKS